VRLIVTTSTSATPGEVAQGKQITLGAASALCDAEETKHASADCLAILKGRVSKAMMVELAVADDAALLQHTFALNGRAVTEPQTLVLLQAVRQFPRNQAPIIASILARRFADWASYDPIPSSIASCDDDDHENAFFDCRSVTSLCCQLFGYMEQCHGRHLLRAAVAYISLARFGLSETELSELLSLSDDVLAEVYGHIHSSKHARDSLVSATAHRFQPIAQCPPAPSCSSSAISSRCCRVKALLEPDSCFCLGGTASTCTC
jgi:hypothetical protein